MINENLNPKKNPWTTISGFLFLSLSLFMAIIKYVLPLFVILKQDASFGYIEMLLMGFIGLVLMFMSDDVFKQIFNAVLNVFKKKTDTQ